MTVIKNTIPDFMRRSPERALAKCAIGFKRRDRAPLPHLRPHEVIHGGVPPLQPAFLTQDGPETAEPDRAAIHPSPAEESAVVDLTAHRSAAASVESAPQIMSRALHAAFEAEAADFDSDDDAAFQVTLPRSVIRQIRLFAAEQGTTHRAVVLRALRTAGLNIPEGADVDRRAMAAKRRHQA